MKKLITFLIFLLAVGQGATAQEVSGQQLPLLNEELHQLVPNTELRPIMPTYSDILMMKALSSSELLATPNMPIVAMPFATAKPLVYGYDASRSETASMEVSKNLRLTATGAYRSYIGLMDVQSVSGGVQYSLGGMTVQGAQVAAADADCNHYLTTRTQYVSCLLDLSQLCLADRCREVQPTQEVVAGTCTIL